MYVGNAIRQVESTVFNIKKNIEAGEHLYSNGQLLKYFSIDKNINWCILHMYHKRGPLASECLLCEPVACHL